MNGRPRKAYASASVGERPQLGRVAGQRLAVLADPQEALLGQAPALVAGHAPAGGRCAPSSPVKWMRYVPGLAGRHDHQVDLRAAQQADRRLVAARVHDAVDRARAS